MSDAEKRKVAGLIYRRRSGARLGPEDDTFLRRMLVRYPGEFVRIEKKITAKVKRDIKRGV